MRIRTSRIKIFALLCAVAIMAIAFSGKVKAQSAGPQMIVTWQAYGSYIPPQYKDKALPNQSSKLTASLALFSAGKPVDLSSQTIYWYLNDTLIGSGVGKQYVVFSPFGTSPAFLDLRAELPSYNGALLMQDVSIPLVSPKAVIEAPHPQGPFSGNPITLQGVPYFFYASDPGALSYSWMVNNQTSASAENPQTLVISLPATTPSGSSLGITLDITNPSDSTTGEDSTNIIYTKQL